ncbi:unnamed protein product [Leuciscus chuanchicus]
MSLWRKGGGGAPRAEAAHMHTGPGGFGMINGTVLVSDSCGWSTTPLSQALSHTRMPSMSASIWDPTLQTSVAQLLSGRKTQGQECEVRPHRGKKKAVQSQLVWL